MRKGLSEGHVQRLRQIAVSGAKIIGVAVLVSAIFLTGLHIGNGTIRFGAVQNTQNKDLPADLDYTSVEHLYDELRSSYDGDLDADKLLDGIKAGLAEASGDPHTVYLNAEQAREFDKILSGTFSGIGAELGKDEAGNLIVVAPIAGFPAAKAGLRAQDVIVSVDKKSTAGLSIEEAVSKIRGPKGTDVILGIVRDKKEDLSFTITREDIKIPSVKYEIIEGNIGYIQISQFINDTAGLTKEAAQMFTDKKVRGVIIDVRGNPGGLLDAALGISSLWLDKGKTILQERRGGLVMTIEVARGGNILKGMPTVVLIDQGSASASEIVAGALRDHGAATLIGVKSFGKGSVQSTDVLPDGGRLKVTIARWYLPNGQNIDKKGVAPDTEVKMTNEDIKGKLDPQKQAAIDFLRK